MSFMATQPLAPLFDNTQKTVFLLLEKQYGKIQEKTSPVGPADSEEPSPIEPFSSQGIIHYVFAKRLSGLHHHMPEDIVSQ